MSELPVLLRPLKVVLVQEVLRNSHKCQFGTHRLWIETTELGEQLTNTESVWFRTFFVVEKDLR